MRRSALGRILWWAAPILLVAGIVLKAADLRKIADALVGARPGWLAGALVLAVLFTLNQGALYRAIFRLFDVKISLRASVRLALVMAFGSLAPAGTVAGIAYFVAAAREHGIPGPRAILTSLAFYLFDYGALLPFVAAGVTVLLNHHDAEARLVIAGGAVLLATAAAAGALLWGLADGRALGTASRLASAVNALVARLHRRPVDPQRAAAWVADLREIAVLLRHSRRRLPALFLYGLAAQVFSLGILAAVLRAVGAPLSIAIAVAGYAVGAIFAVVSIAPSLGIVETAMTLALVSVAVPLDKAVAAAVLFRLSTLWLPMLAGYVAVRYARGAASPHPSTLPPPSKSRVA